MTTPKEALELKPCPFCGGEAESDSTRGYCNISTGNPEKAAAIYCTKCSADMTWCYRDTPEIERDEVMTLLIEQWNTRATASFKGDAVERVAQLIEDHVTAHCDDERCQTWLDNTRDAAESILVTGLVPDEAAVRASAFEEAARIAEGEVYKERYRTWPWWKHDADNIGNADRESALVKHADAIAAAIRSNGRGA